MGIMKDITLTVLTSPGCTHCKHFLEFWKNEQVNFKHVKMEEVSILTERGQSLAREHSVFASPGIIVGDELFSMGGYNEDEFKKRLREVSGEVV